MSKAVLFVILYSGFLLTLFSVMCYLITTVNPDKILSSSKGSHGDTDHGKEPDPVPEAPPSPESRMIRNKKVTEYLRGIFKYFTDSNYDDVMDDLIVSNHTNATDGKDQDRNNMNSGRRRNDIQRVHPPLRPLIEILNNLSLNLPIQFDNPSANNMSDAENTTSKKVARSIENYEFQEAGKDLTINVIDSAGNTRVEIRIPQNINMHKENVLNNKTNKKTYNVVFKTEDKTDTVEAEDNVFNIYLDGKHVVSNINFTNEAGNSFKNFTNNALVNNNT